MKTKTPTKPKRVRPTLAEMKRLRQSCESEERVIRNLQESRDRCHETNTRLAKEVHDLTEKLLERELAAVERERTQSHLRPRKLTLWERLTGWGRPIQLAGPVTAAEAGAEKPEPTIDREAFMRP